MLQVNDDQNYWLPGLTQYGVDVGYSFANLSNVVTAIELIDSSAVNNPGDDSTNANDESMLDLEGVVAVTTQLNLYAMKCSEDYCQSSDNLFSTLTSLPTSANPLPQVISYSYGSAEFSQQTQYESTIQALTALGTTFIASIGDCSYGNPSWPATSAYVLSVGGTIMTLPTVW